MVANITGLIETQNAQGRLKKIGRRKIVTLPIERVHPVVRIAHRMTSTHDIHRRWIRDHEIIVCCGHASGWLVRDDDKIEIKPFDLVVVEPYVAHEIHVDAKRGFDHIAVHFDWAADVPSDDDDLEQRSAYGVQLTHGLGWPEHWPLSRGHGLVQKLEEVVHAFGHDWPAAGLETSSLMMSVMVDLIRLGNGACRAKIQRKSNENCGGKGGVKSGGVGGEQRVRIERALAMLDRRFCEDVPVSEMAEAAGLSVTHFGRLFRVWTGQSPARYMRERRVREARRLLGDIDFSIKQIAVKTGFKTPYHFSKVFRQVDGLSPSQYREAVLAGRVGPNDR